MKDIKRKYKRKCKTRIITFYLKENELYEFSKTLNFQATIKNYLNELMKGKKHNGNL